MPFTIPAKLSFFLAGHDGEPDHPPVNKNLVRLLSASTREVLAKAAPPRNDEAQRVTWELSQHAGKQGILEVVDGHDDDSFAWLAVGRFDPPVISLPVFIPNSTSQRQQNAAELVRRAVAGIRIADGSITPLARIHRKPVRRRPRRSSRQPADLPSAAGKESCRRESNAGLP
jgi:hypothetical protein